MALSENNDLTFGLRGRFGKQFSFRQRFGKIIAAHRPLRRMGPTTAAQQATQNKFSEGAIYAKGIIADPVSKELYGDLAHTGVTAYNRALADFIKAPQVVNIKTDTYLGQAGNTLLIRAVDDFKVTAVKVSITEAAGDPVEEGNAVIQPNGADWLYTATAVNAIVAGSKIKAAAYDLAGNITSLEVTVNN